MVPTAWEIVEYYCDIVGHVIAIRVPEPEDAADLADIAVRHIAGAIQIAIRPEFETQRLVEITRKSLYLAGINKPIVVKVRQYEDLAGHRADKQAASRIECHAGRSGGHAVEVRNKSCIG